MAKIEGIGPETPTVTNAEGGKQSALPYRFDLIDSVALFALAEVLAKGAAKYGEENWRKLSTRDHINHIIAHCYAYLAGDSQDDHLAHALTRAMMAVAMEKQKQHGE